MNATPVENKWRWVSGPVAVALGLAAHFVSGGSAPAIPVLLGFVALAALGAQLVSRWIHGPILLLLVSGATQQILFFGFEGLGGSFPGLGTLDHFHGTGQVPADLPVSPSGSTPVHAADLMLYTHAAAAILTLLIGAVVARLAGRSWHGHSLHGPQQKANFT